MISRRIYLDNAATTKMSKTAIDAMLPYMDGIYGNPSSLHSVGQKASEALVIARERIAKLLGCEAREITFSSGGSEADNQAIISAARIGEKSGKKHIISTAFEHHAVLHTLNRLEKEGFEVTLLDVHENGIILPEQIAEAIREDTCLVTVMYANNEIGTIQPIEEIGAVCREKGVLFHTDAVGPSNSLMPYFVTISLAMDVARSISLDAPVVISLITSSSAARPPRRLMISCSIIIFVIYILSSPGSGMV